MGANSTNPYTSQSISGYNSSPPPDDGTQTAANQLSWAKHKTKLADPIKILSEGINTAVSATFAKTINTDANVGNQISGSLALEWATATIGTDAISPTYSAVLLGTESGATSDTLQTITATGVYNGALLTIRQRNATEEINLIHATSTAATATAPNIYLANKGNLRLDALGKVVELQYDSNTASGWVETNIAGAWEDDVVASNTTTNIWFGGGETVHISGTTTITSFGTAPFAGAWKKVIFDGALTLTHGANLSLPGLANITTAADDIAFVYADTTTQFDVLYFKKSGAATVGAWDLLQTATASASATIDLETGIGATYDDYVIIADGVRPATDNALLYCRLKIAGAYAAASYAYHADVSSSSAATYSGIASGSAGQIQICSALDNTTAASNLCFAMHVFNVNSTSLSRSVTWSGTNRLTGEVARADGSGDNSGAGAVTGVRFLMDTGNISVGTFRLYGVRK